MSGTVLQEMHRRYVAEYQKKCLRKENVNMQFANPFDNIKITTPSRWSTHLPFLKGQYSGEPKLDFYLKITCL